MLMLARSGTDSEKIFSMSDNLVVLAGGAKDNEKNTFPPGKVIQ